MNYVLQALTQEKVVYARKEADPDIFLSQRNYLGVSTAQQGLDVTPTTPTQQYGAVAGLVTIIDGTQTIKLAPGEVYEGGSRFV